MSEYAAQDASRLSEHVPEVLDVFRGVNRVKNKKKL